MYEVTRKFECPRSSLSVLREMFIYFNFKILTHLVKVPQTWTSRVSLFCFLLQYFDVLTWQTAAQSFFVYGIYSLVSYKDSSQPCCSHALVGDHQKSYNPITGSRKQHHHESFCVDLKKVTRNYCDFDVCLKILCGMGFLSLWEARRRRTCSSWCLSDCVLLLS